MAQDAPAIDSMKKTLYLLLLLLLLPTAVSASVGLTAFFTQAGDDEITIIWETESETQNSGYNVYRTTENVSEFTLIVDKVRVNSRPIAPLGELGGRYELVDESPMVNTTYYYWLEDIDTNGNASRHGPALGRIEQGTVLNPPTATPLPTVATETTTTPPTVTVSPTTIAATTTPLAASPTSVPTTQATTAATATATAEPTATATDQARVFITPSTTSGDSSSELTSTPLPTQSSATAQSTLVSNSQGDVVATATPQPTTENRVATATSDGTVIVNPTTAVIQPPTAASEDSPTSGVIVETNSDEPETSGDLQNDTAEQPTGDVNAVDPATEGDTEPSSESVEVQTLSPTEAAVAEVIGDPMEVDPNAIGEDTVTDVQQPSIVQPQSSDDNGIFLWFGLVAGGLLIFVGAGFALLFLGNRKP